MNGEEHLKLFIKNWFNSFGFLYRLQSGLHGLLTFKTQKFMKKGGLGSFVYVTEIKETL